MTLVLMRAQEVAEQLGVHVNTVRNWEKKGVLRAYKLPGSGHRRFNGDQVDQLRKEMLTQLAPFDEGTTVKNGFDSDARIVHGDDIAE